MLLATTTMAASPILAAVPVPKGFVNMCLDHPAECRGGGPSMVHYSAALRSKLDAVNRRVNSRIRPVRKEVIDVWSINVDRGDCEEYVLAKRRALINAGVPASALSIVYALRHGGGHAVLAIHTDHGTLTLDNLSSRIKALSATGYKIISMSGPDPMVWHRP